MTSRRKGISAAIASIFGVISYSAGLAAYALIIALGAGILLGLIAAADVSTPVVINPNQEGGGSGDASLAVVVLSYVVGAIVLVLLVWGVWRTVVRFMHLVSKGIHKTAGYLFKKPGVYALVLTKLAFYAIPALMGAVIYLSAPGPLTLAFLASSAAASLIAALLAIIQGIIWRVARQNPAHLL